MSSSNEPPLVSERFWYGAFGVLVLTIALRQLRLGEASFMPDEAIHAFFSWGFNDYHYDPVYHGPLLYHLVSFVFSVFGQYDYTARIVPALQGIGLVALILGPARKFLGQRGAIWAALIVAVSPSIVTYSRHLLHDSQVLLLTLGAALCFITTLQHPSNSRQGRNGFIGLAACLALFLATKANFFFILVLILAFWGNWYLTGRKIGSLNKLISGQFWPPLLFAIVTVSAIVWPRDNTFKPEEQNFQHKLFQIIAVACCGLMWFWLFSRPQSEEETRSRESFHNARDWSVPILGAAAALWIYVFMFGNGAQIITKLALEHHVTGDALLNARESAQGAIGKMLDYWGGQQASPRLPSRHDYYLVLALLYEVPVLIVGAMGVWHATKKRTVWSDWLLFWAFGSWAVYAVANEKVPWLLVHMVLPLALLGGMWMATLDWRKPAFIASVAAGLLFNLRGDYAMMFQRAGDNAEPLLYAQTPDKFKDAINTALKETNGDSRGIWMARDRQWPTVWYVRESGEYHGKSGHYIGNNFDPTGLRLFVANEPDWAAIIDRSDWNTRRVEFLVWDRVSWKGLTPNRYWHWFWTRDAMPEDIRDGTPLDSKISILDGKGEWSHQYVIVGWRKQK